MDFDKLLDTILESQAVEAPPAENSPEVDVPAQKDDALLHLALSNIVHGPDSLENDLVSLAQATKDSLKQFLAGKSDIEAVDSLSTKLQDASSKLNSAVDQVKAQVGNDTLSKDTVKQLRVTGNRFARLKPRTQARLLKQINVDSFHDDVATAAKPDGKKKNIAHHVASYALTKPRQKNYRIATDKDRGRGVMHLFKRGKKYIGFAVVDKLVTNEDFDDQMDILLSEEPMGKSVLVYSGDNLADVFNINNYKRELPNGPEVADYLNGKFGTKLRTLSPAVVNQLKDAPAKETEPAPAAAPAAAAPAVAPAKPAEKPAEAVKPDITKQLAPLSDKYLNSSKNAEPQASHVYKLVGTWLSKAKTKADFDHYVGILQSALDTENEKATLFAKNGKSDEAQKAQIASKRLGTIIKDLSQVVIP